MTPTPVQHSAPSRTVSSDRYEHVYADQIVRQDNLEERCGSWLASFHKRFPEARVR